MQSLNGLNVQVETRLYDFRIGHFFMKTIFNISEMNSSKSFKQYFGQYLHQVLA